MNYLQTSRTNTFRKRLEFVIICRGFFFFLLFEEDEADAEHKGGGV